MKRILIAVAVFALACACNTPRPAGNFNTSTIFGVDITAWDAAANSPKVMFGLVRHESVQLDTNAIQGTTFTKATDFEDDGWFEGNRAHTVLSFGKDAVHQPSAAQQMPSAKGSNVVWQTAQPLP